MAGWKVEVNGPRVIAYVNAPVHAGLLDADGHNYIGFRTGRGYGTGDQNDRPSNFFIGFLQLPCIVSRQATVRLDPAQIGVNFATDSANHFTPWRGKLTWARASLPVPSMACTLPSPNLL
jgi:hypothetical protein